MEHKKPYRNAIRSKQMIRQAYMELLREKPYEKITATDIIQKADINRSTFYAHYPDVRGIMDEIMAEITELFRSMLRTMDFSKLFEDPMPILRLVIDFLQQNQEMYQIILKSSMALEQLDELKNVLISEVMQISNLPGGMSPAGKAVRVHMLLGGLVDVCRYWLEGEIPCSLEEAAQEVAMMIRTFGTESK